MRRAKLNFWISGEDFLYLNAKVSADNHYMRKFIVAQLTEQGWRREFTTYGDGSIELYKDLGIPDEITKEDIEAKLPVIDTEKLKRKIEEVEKIRNYEKEIEIVID